MMINRSSQPKHANHWAMVILVSLCMSFACGKGFHGHGCREDETELANPESTCTQGTCIDGLGNWDGSQIQFQYCEDLVNGGWREGTKRIKVKGYHYSGSWKNGKKDGKGVWILPDGSKYVGDFIGGEKHGFGRSYDRAGKITFEGRYERDSPLLHGSCLKGDCVDGYGTKNWERSSYTGYFKRGLRHGSGMYTTLNGREIYKGEWLNDFKNGYGVFTVNGAVKYAGQWKNDKKDK